MIVIVLRSQTRPDHIQNIALADTMVDTKDTVDTSTFDSKHDNQK